jgi:hypothetical protein
VMKLLSSRLIVQGLQPVSSDDRSLHITCIVHRDGSRVSGDTVRDGGHLT